jgi:hypothetical protein
MLGPVTTLQNVAVISSMQNTPVVGAWDGWGAWGTTDPLPSLQAATGCSILPVARPQAPAVTRGKRRAR